MEKEPITKDGLEKLKLELENLKNIERPKIVEAISEARSHGDLKENYDYKAAKEKMDLVVYRRQLLQSFAPFKFVDFSDIDTEDVSFGN